MTLRRMHAERGWILPFAGAAFLLLAAGAYFDALPWDRPITNAAIDARSAWRDDLARIVTTFGSTKVVLAVAALSSAAAWRRCPRLAIFIIAVAVARPLLEFTLKELIDRERPTGDQLVSGNGPSFPSGHVLATAASWGLVPLVAALYTRRRLLWWAVTISVWTLVGLVAVTRVWLGVHWTSDVVAGALLAVLGVAAAERFMTAAHAGHPCTGPPVLQGSNR